MLATAMSMGCSVQDEVDAEPTEFRTAFPSGYERYCSVQWADGTWAVEFGGPDPCAAIDELYGGGFAIERAGRYSASGLNNVVMRCAQIVWWGRVQGEDALAMGRGYADDEGLTHCTMTAAPASLPIFDAPFPLEAGAGGNGFDFAYEPLDVAEFGQPSEIANVVDWLGRARDASGWVDGHQAVDYGMPVGTPIYAVADGVVIMAQNRDVSGCGCGNGGQQELMIRHALADPSLRFDPYAERFVTYYAHFDSIDVSEGDWVQQGELIGRSGNTGCSSGPHLHFAVKRLTNTASELYDGDHTPVGPEPEGCPSEDNSVAEIDPYGWWPNEIGFDPWGWRYHDKGALSIELWRPGQAPHRE